jgi:hypothetical protein
MQIGGMQVIVLSTTIPGSTTVALARVVCSHLQRNPEFQVRVSWAKGRTTETTHNFDNNKQNGKARFTYR